MAASIEGVLDDTVQEKVDSAKVFVVGAGGIGCELLKNLILTGFKDIEVIDLDTVDVSNLNRQFLFQKQHVGKSKAKVARESVLMFNPQAKIKAYHDSIMNPEYGVDFFQQFTIVMNALDNKAARNHVNRMCLAANIPLIESGTAGYLGQVTVIKKGLTECYECQPKPAQKTFPGCTIRNTPSEPVHCIVWAKHLFNQLFGEQDPDEDVSPDTEDPEAAGDAAMSSLESTANSLGNIQRISTHSWAVDCGYDAVKLFTKLFHDDINYLLSMDKLWETRRRPTPLDWAHLPTSVAGGNRENGNMRDQQLWSIQECANIFKDSIGNLKEKLENLGEDGVLIWDKDDEACINFTASCANIRCYIFGISQKSKFDIKSIAGNIIPAIATTNAIIAGAIVMEALKILMGNLENCRTIYLNRKPNPKKKLLVPCLLDKPNPKCYVCSAKPEVTLKLNVNALHIKTLEEKILKNTLNMVAPDVEIDDGKGTILISSEEGETEENNTKFLCDFGIGNGSRLKCDDFQQSYQLNINIIHSDKLEHGLDFEIIGNINQLHADNDITADKNSKNGINEPRPGTSQDSDYHIDDDDDLIIIEEDRFLNKSSPNGDKMDICEHSGKDHLNNINYNILNDEIGKSKRKADSIEGISSSQFVSKKRRLSDKEVL